MANTFNQATKSSLVTTVISNSGTNVLTAGGSSTLILLSAMVANKTSSSVNIDLYVVPNSGDAVYLLKEVPVPAGSSLELISGSKLLWNLVMFYELDVIQLRLQTLLLAT